MEHETRGALCSARGNKRKEKKIQVVAGKWVFYDVVCNLEVHCRTREPNSRVSFEYPLIERMKWNYY